MQFGVLNSRMCFIRLFNTPDTHVGEQHGTLRALAAALCVALPSCLTGLTQTLKPAAEIPTLKRFRCAELPPLGTHTHAQPPLACSGSHIALLHMRSGVKNSRKYYFFLFFTPDTHEEEQHDSQSIPLAAALSSILPGCLAGQSFKPEP
jgi:hypothetical protein